MITVENLTVRYGELKATDQVTLRAADGLTVGLVGPNGSGKSSVLRAILGGLHESEGVIAIDGQATTTLSSRARSRQLAVVAQEETSDFPLTVWDAVLLGRSVYLSGWSSYREADKSAAEAAMRQTGVWAFADRPLSALSGGERQRVLIARALAQGATHLLLDEPTNHLDVRFQHEILSLVSSLPLCTIVVLHDLNLAARYCEEIVLLSKGRIVAAGEPGDVLTAQLLEPVYEISVRRVDQEGVPQLLFSPRERAITEVTRNEPISMAGLEG
ncbi:ABC transporter ATP-binding protein [Natronoglycomyces albus]|uniref:ABC transporter ATP-binding protein n=1 Tax=Natronoglycomyces albus TaxID=2811108 RepID=A0A895XME6_9ACTN|nr:ABC transporter ATP-binding protein [Natronoglycomyces albus]QSB04175.1 ABC transporter ATP-binding protein [Natronoglycomyces albus]